MTTEPHSRVDAMFARCREERRAALMPFLTAGYPSLDVTRDLLLQFAEAGADAVEIGIPFSDPIADGPVIAASMHEALTAGVTPDDVFELVQEIRSRTTLAMIAMVSASIVRRYGNEAFVAKAAGAGFDGLIIPDLDTNDAAELAKRAAEFGLSFSLLVSPNSTDERIAFVTRHCRGFVYGLARLGITGEQEQAPEAASLIERVRKTTELPIAMGFGISNAAHVSAIADEGADAAIVGSALVRRLADAGDPVHAGCAFVRELAKGIGSGHPAN